MRGLARTILPLFALLSVAAAPDNFSRGELDKLIAEKEAAEARLAALEAAKGKTGADLADLDSRLIAAALESKRREEQASQAERRMIDLDLRREGLRSKLVSDQDGLEDLLGAIALSGTSHPPALVSAPNDASNAIRSAILMGETAPVLKAETDALAGELRELERVERELAKEQARLDAAEAVLAEKKFEIEELVATKQAANADLTAEAEQLRREVRKLADRALTLQQLIAGLEDIAPAPPRLKPEPPKQYASLKPGTGVGATRRDTTLVAKALDDKALGGMTRPAAGMLALRFGETSPVTKTRSEGLVIRTRQDAQIVAPVDGRIVFAKPFRSYGEMLILTTSDGYHVILSGMSELYGAEDQWVSAGEPVGRMANISDPPPELYLEVRKDGAAMDPSRWMKDGR